MWTPDGVALIDPAAHGGHRETDLAMLALFGCPHLDEVIAGYESVRPLWGGWRGRIALHQLYPCSLMWCCSAAATSVTRSQRYAAC